MEIKKKADVSVVIPLYNGERFIKQAIESVLRQSFKDFEIIVVDDGSLNREGEKIVRELQKKDRRIRYFRKENKGVSSARNFAIKKAKGKYIALLDQDDLWMPDKLEKQLELFKKSDKIGLVFSDAIYIRDNGKKFYSLFRKVSPKRGNVFRNLLVRNFISSPTIVVRRNVLDDVGFFDEDFKMIEDYDIALRIAYEWEIDYFDKPLAMYRMHENSYTFRSMGVVLQEGIILLKKFERLYPGFKSRFREEITNFKKKISSMMALFYWRKSQGSKARRYFKKYLFIDRRLTLAYFLTFIPYVIFNMLQTIYYRLK